MQAWKMLLSRLFVVLLPVMIIEMRDAEAAQKAKKSAPKAAPKTVSSAIIGESDDSDTVPMDEDNDDIAADEVAPAAVKSKEALKGKDKKSKGNKEKDNKEGDKENAKTKKRDKEREKLREGFRQAEDFHNTWYNLPGPKIKTSLEKLTKFCKFACTKSQCMNEEVANNCHLMCPESTTKHCPDPLKQSGDEDLATEEVMVSDTSSNDPAAFIDDSAMQASASPPMADSIDQGDSELMNGEGEGG